MSIVKKPYGGIYPREAEMLIKEGLADPPRQKVIDKLRWAEGLEITYKLKDIKPSKFRQISDLLLMLAYKEALRYNEYQYKFAGFEVKLGRLAKGRDLPETVTFQCAMHPDPEIMVWGPGYEVPQKFFLYNKVDDIIEIAKRYADRVSKQNPYRVVKLFISIRQPRPVEFGPMAIAIREAEARQKAEEKG